MANPTLVTGASGLIGGYVARALLARGEPVRALLRPHSAAKLASLAGQLEVVHGDLRDAGSLPAAVKGARRIFHCAGLVTDWARLEDYQAVNVAGTRALLDAVAVEGACERFVYTSTTDVYGYPDLPGADEATPLREVGLPYSSTKLQAERLVWQAHRKLGLPVTILRPADVYGPGDPHFIPDIVDVVRSGLFPLIAGGRADAGLVYVANLAEAAMLAGQAPQAVGQAYNVTDGTGVSWRQYVAALASLVGARPRYLSLPLRVALVVGQGMEAVWGALRLEGRPLVTRHAALVMGTSQGFSNTRLRQLGWQPGVNFEQGLAAVGAWLAVR